MGTRSLTFVYNDQGKPIINFYRQYDGYPSGHGAELAAFLAPLTVVNGFGGDTTNLANGMGCLAAQLVAHFKDGCGGFYLHPVTETDCGQDYEYHVYPDRVEIKNYSGNLLFNESWKEMKNFCSEEETA